MAKRQSIRLVLLSLTILLYAFISADKSPDRKGKDHALFFAMKDYDHWGDLRNPIKDARVIAKDLRELYGFKTEVVENPTKEQIHEKLSTYRKRRFAKDAQLLIFFTGHGEFNEEIQEGYFIPRDAEKNDRFQTSYFAHPRLEKEINSIPCEHILVAIDACYSGTFSEEIALQKSNDKGKPGERPGETTKGRRQLFINNTLKYKTRLFLTSGGKERTPDGKEHSPFTTRFLAALRSFDSNSGVLTFNKLVSFMEEAVPRPRWGWFRGNEIGSDFLFVLEKFDGIAHDPTIVDGNHEYTLYMDGTLLDKRDGQTYKTAKLVGKTWMAENLNYKTAHSYCYDDDRANCEIYGGLYDWWDSREACPVGWRLPKDDEWKKLSMYYGGYYDAIEELEKGDSKKSYKALIKMGGSGFEALFGGFIRGGNGYGSLGEIGYYWCDDRLNDGKRWDYYALRHVFNSKKQIVYRDFSMDYISISCRCIKN